MTDIPQLRTDLVRAGARRRRRGRLGAAVAGAAAVAAAAFAVASLQPAPEQEVTPAAPGETASERLERAYGVFRRPARPRDRFRGRLPSMPAHPMRIARSRFLGRLGPVHHYLVESREGDLCLMSGAAGGRRAGGGCGKSDTYLDGKRPIGSYSDEEGPARPVFVFPDGVREVALDPVTGPVVIARVRDNAVLRQLPARLARMRWTAPDGTAQEMTFHAAPPVDPADFFGVLKRGDEIVAAERSGSRATISSRDGKLCLRLEALGSELEGCRRKVADVRRGLLVFVADAHGGRTLAGAFADHIRTVQLRFADGTRRTVAVRDNVVLVPDASQLVSLHYRKVYDRVPDEGGRGGIVNTDVGP